MRFTRSAWLAFAATSVAVTSTARAEDFYRYTVAVEKEKVVLRGADPLTGKELWELKGSTTECVTSTVTDGKHVFTSGGYPKNHVAAVRADGSGVAWENKSRVYVPSMLYRDGHLYADEYSYAD